MSPYIHITPLKPRFVSLLGDAELDEGTESTFVDPADDPEMVLQNKDRGEVLHKRWVGEDSHGRKGGATLNALVLRDCICV